MSLKICNKDNFSKHPIDYPWDDQRVFECLVESDKDFIKEINSLSPEAQVAFSVSLFEWIASRLQLYVDQDLNSQIIEMYRCSLTDRHCGKYFELPSSEWKGSSLRPYFIGVGAINDILFQRELGTGADPEELGFLDRIVRHILPEHETYLHWRSEVLKRLQKDYPKVEEDLFDNVFDDIPKPEPIPYEIFDIDKESKK